MPERPPLPPREPDHDEDASRGDPDYVPHEREEFLEEIEEEREERHRRTEREKHHADESNA